MGSIVLVRPEEEEVSLPSALAADASPIVTFVLADFLVVLADVAVVLTDVAAPFAGVSAGAAI